MSILGLYKSVFPLVCRDRTLRFDFVCQPNLGRLDFFHESILELWKQIFCLFLSLTGLYCLGVWGLVFNLWNFGLGPSSLIFGIWHSILCVLVGFGAWDTILAPILATHEHCDSKRQLTPRIAYQNSTPKKREILKQYLWNSTFFGWKVDRIVWFWL